MIRRTLEFLAKIPAEEHRAMWKNFLLSIGVLSVALLSALYSTSAARAGRITHAVPAALIALGLALWVGVRFVPNLARGVDWAWLPIFSKYRITREGGIFFGALLIVLSAAINTANNLLYMVLSALLAVLLLSGVLSALNFRFLELELLLPDRAFAGQSFPIDIRVRNHRRLFPAFSLFAEPAGSSLYFTVVPPRSAVIRSGELKFSRRGRHSIDKLRTASRFPFGFFSKVWDYKIESECICYPLIRAKEELDLSITDIQGANPHFERGLGYDLYTIRDYVPSDSARHVHWKASAKTAALKTREFAAEDTRHVTLVFDRYGNPHNAQQFEEHVSKAASIAFHLTHSGAEIALRSDEWESPKGSPETVLDSILRYLALVDMAPGAPLPQVDPQSGALLMSVRTRRG
jgi:uncharacterized protein (DUF58 family)